MGLVTIFSIEDCPHCSKAKALLEEEQILFYEISLTAYPQKRRDMIKLAGKLSVPQIFFNDIHVGGATELIAMRENNTLNSLWQKTIMEGEPENLASFTIPPGLLPNLKPIPSPRNIEMISIERQSWTYIQMSEYLNEPRYSGCTIVKSIQEKLEVSETEAVSIAKQAIELNIISGNVACFDMKSTRRNYVTSRFRNKDVLNSYRFWSDRVDEPMTLVSELKKKVSKLVSKYRDANGLVDYVEAANDTLYLEFDEASCEIQKIRLASLGESTRLAFSINLYNVMLLHAYLKVGCANNDLGRVDFFDYQGYNIGGDFYSFNDLENGILRGNKRPPYHMYKTIGKNDARLSSVLPLNPKVHMSLNCGAHSCPPVKSFTAEAVEDELVIVTRAFLEQEENCKIDSNSLTVSTIMKWYASDFGKNDKEIASWVLQFISEDRQVALKKLIDTGSFSLAHSPYDWSNDAKRIKIYNVSRRFPWKMLFKFRMKRT